MVCLEDYAQIDTQGGYSHAGTNSRPKPRSNLPPLPDSNRQALGSPALKGEYYCYHYRIKHATRNRRVLIDPEVTRMEIPPITLGFVLVDYIGHLDHHLRQLPGYPHAA